MSLKELAEDIYAKLPAPLQSLAIGIEGFRINRRRYGKSFRSSLEQACDRQHLKGKELEQYQGRQLERHLENALNCPFWKAKFGIHGVNPKGSDPFAELAKLPILGKEEVKANSDGIRNQAISPRALIPTHTSGSTGSGLKFWQTPEAETETWATWWRYRANLGIAMSEKCGYFGGRSVVRPSQSTPPYWKNNRFSHQLLLSAYHLKSTTAVDYVKALRRYDPEWLHGYPSFINLLAIYCEELSISSLMPKIRLVTTGAENLLASQKSRIEKTFETRVYQHYGQAEAIANFSQDKNSEYKVDEDYSMVEFIPIEGLQGQNRIIGTNWTNPAFPLFRYDSGDIATVKPPTPNSWRIIDHVDGRQEDYLTLPNGAKIGRLDHIFKDIEEIKEAQFQQENTSEVDLLLVPNRAYNDQAEKRLKQEISKRIGTQIIVNLKQVDSIKKTKSGKLRFVISKIDAQNSNVNRSALS